MLLTIVNFVEPGKPEKETKFAQDPPLVKSLQDWTIVESWKDEKLKSTTFNHVTENEEVLFGYTSKNKREMTLASEGLDDSLVYVKQPGLQRYEDMIGTNHLPKAVLDETLVM
ncbi:hypothetical protein PDIG_45820 [Penicillium digitatum PHI26]|uniref:Uncharacterized protein n=2 Tax=Penicillium digitatum TaxID=36651 RepID=K9FUP3_PEND2|nr:hypothetical protein PDIP_17750 [Penicillium digitatum Pd1]EKV12257.1 hypothetical protein PDIG_45820 [Penicillium digitatum PHI26]EKV20294.1 hypothetical protein PDIP_17750 [Penicillium digitatum Pd1]KAG0160524.1 hypothetical protein PDIDSM_8054 [Penicillium digitatum]